MVQLIELQELPEKNTKEIEELKTLEPKLIKEQEAEQKQVEAVMATIASEAKALTEKKDKLQNQLVGLNEVTAEQKSKVSDLDACHFGMVLKLCQSQIIDMHFIF